jgi:hypothetical protein
MNAPTPIVAVFGSVRSEIVGSKEEEAHTACVELGSELARQGWNIAVYSSDKTFIEADVVQGFISQGTRVRRIHHLLLSAGCQYKLPRDG